MAKIDPASLFTEVRGKLGGFVFSSNGAGFYVKKLTRPLKNPTTAQRTKRNTLREAAAWWRVHSEDQYEDPEKGLIPVREWWADFAAEPGEQKQDYFGGTYSVSGYNLFLAYAIFNQMQGLSIQALPPDPPYPDPWEEFTFAFHKSGAATDSYFSAPTTSALESSRPWIAARPVYILRSDIATPPYYAIANFDYTNASSEYSLQNDLESVFGTIPEICTLSVSVRFRHDNGRFSTPVTFSLKENESYTYEAPA